MADELKVMMGIYAFCAEIDAARAKDRKAPQAQQASGKKADKSEESQVKGESKKEEAPKKKEPPAKKVLEPPSPELLAKHARLVAVGEECLEKEELLALMQARPDAFRLYVFTLSACG